ncbi:hypothetical protein NUW58_g3373 [Xylaria curta]|uniref:Uncharacterized protein n=1 Tax=Xylaria curta TaxID=42375 RepID=A0ACC1PCW7_9PEZI|nr:hypothetical protein NUW58_g3373 [Xylaria curta]
MFLKICNLELQELVLASAEARAGRGRDYGASPGTERVTVLDWPMCASVLKMLRSLFLSAVIHGGLVAATTVTLISSHTGSSCSYNFGTGGVPLTPVPTQSTRTYLTIRETRPTVTIPTVVTVSAPTTITKTVYTTTFTTYIQHVGTISTWTQGAAYVSTIATATFASTVCANGANPTTVTKYTGTYSPISGQSTTIPSTYPTEAFCTTATSYYQILFPTETSGFTTTTVTPTTLIPLTTSTATYTVDFGTVYVTLTTVTATRTTWTVPGVSVTKTVACDGPTYTKTMDARCAPTNLIGDINGKGLLSGTYADRSVVAYNSKGLWLKDYTACCQACLDNKGCGAAMADVYGCGLLYIASEKGEPVCDAFIYSFTAWNYVLPGQGLVNSNGCDWVEYEPRNLVEGVPKSPPSQRVGTRGVSFEG